MDLVTIFGGLALVTLMVLLIGWLMVRRRQRQLSAADQRYLAKRWAEIKALPASDPKMAVLKADSLVYEALKRRGYQGSMGEILKLKPTIIKNLDDLWQAHKLRNRIAHELDCQVSQRQAEKMLNHFASTLRSLGVKKLTKK